uniref:ATP synthase subunit a n=2 Tax=Pylaiella littoralis TaxID=2885 RepID=ATP6_PYLLI|nr:ATP synthase F0 subunit a [Pylaiella littoralis]Q37601.1 RecName: Full=ATP synthase subunit a; AltName: Full=F-ATPase protein 6 [Pylaiella littoralis]CAA86023.1 ATP synthetase, subunit 6 [Pylaiella littoralis]CAC50844.1 ATPase subunit 6 [Pylaiella littoralis]
MFNSPLEQFEILPLLSFGANLFDFSITNAMLTTCVSLSFFLFLFYCLFSYGLNSFPTRWQLVLEGLYTSTAGLVWDSVGPRRPKVFPFLFVIFSFILISNVQGLVPYSFTITSHLIQTMVLALTVFIGVIIIVLAHGFHMLSLFLPGGTSIVLAFLLVPIEIVSYVFKPLSLAVRLFANMMAGHTLLKVIAAVAWAMMGSGGLLLIAHIVPLGVLVILFGLELAVALIQAYVFTILSCIYINDAIVLH